MLFAPKHLEIVEIQNEILTLDEISNIHHVHIWQLNDHDIHFEAHIEFKKHEMQLKEFEVELKKSVREIYLKIQNFLKED